MSAQPKRLPILLAFLTLAAVLVTIIAVLATRPDAIDPLDPPAPSPTPAPSDWLTPGRSVRHLAVTPVSLNKIPLHQISLPATQSPDLVRPTADGGCLAISSVSLPSAPTGTPTSETTATASSSAVDTASPTGTASKTVILRAIRFKANGSVLWDHQYDTARDDGFLMSCCVFADGSFAVGMQVYADSAGTGVSALPASPGDPPRIEARLLRFSADGTLLWTAESSLTPAGSLECLFALGDGSILSAGTIERIQTGMAGTFASPSDWTSDGSSGSSSGGPEADRTHSQVSVQHFDLTGKRLGQVFLTRPLVADAAAGGAAGGAIGEAGHQLLQDAAWSEGAGLVIAWRYYLSAPAVSDPAAQGACLTALNADLNERWSVRLPDGANIGETVALAGSAGILATGTAPAASGSDTGTRSTLFHFNLQGTLDWSFAAGAPGTWLLAPARLSDGRIVLGQYQVRTESSEATALLSLKADGSPDATLAELPGRLEQLVPAGDGDFTSVLRQVVQALPQPPYISSLWQDSEAIVCRFDRSLNLVWRRTIDQYKWERRTDLIVVSAMDRLFVG